MGTTSASSSAASVDYFEDKGRVISRPIALPKESSAAPTIQVRSPHLTPCLRFGNWDWSGKERDGITGGRRATAFLGSDVEIENSFVSFFHFISLVAPFAFLFRSH